MVGINCLSLPHLKMTEPQLIDVVSVLSSEECMVTLAKVLDNILTESSYDKKTRKLKLTNKTFSRRVARHKGGIDFLRACKFSEKGESLHLKRQNEDKAWLWEARHALDKRAKELSFDLPNMPSMPDLNIVPPGSKEVDESSLFENSTIATMDELESEIQKELDSPIDQSHYDQYSPSTMPLVSENINQAERATAIDKRADASVETAHDVSDIANDTTKLEVGNFVSKSLLSEDFMDDGSLKVNILASSNGDGSDNNMGESEMPDSITSTNQERQVHELDQFDALSPPSTDVTGWSSLDQFSALSPPSTDACSNTLEAEEESFAVGHSSTIHRNDRSSSVGKLNGVGEGIPIETYKTGADSIPEEKVKGESSPPFSNVMESSNDTPEHPSRGEIAEPFQSEPPLNVDEVDLLKEMNEFLDGKEEMPKQTSRGTTKNGKIESTQQRKESIYDSTTMKQNNMVATCEIPVDSKNDDLLSEMNAFLQEESSSSNLCIKKPCHKWVEQQIENTRKQDNGDLPEQINNVAPLTIPTNDDDYFRGSESGPITALESDIDDDLPRRKSSPPADDLEKEMATMLAISSDTPSGQFSPVQFGKQTKTGIKELDDDASMQSSFVQPDDKSIGNKSFPEQIQAARRFGVDRGVHEEMKYSSIQAHKDWHKLHKVMQEHSLVAEYEICWGALCTLSVVCSELSTETFGLPTDRAQSRRKSHSHSSKRSWLPIELVQGLWNLVLTSQKSMDASRVAHVCSKMHDVLIDSRHLEIYDNAESGENLPHSSWIRVRKEKMVLLGFALPVSISNQASWMRTMAKAISGDTQFWYGRYALPTIAIAGGDNEAKAKSLLRDIDFIQSRLDVIGIVTGTQRHIMDCKTYVKTKRHALKDARFHNDEFRAPTDEEIGYDVALDGSQQVATCLYRIGQLLTKSSASMDQMIELATALRLVGTAVGEWGDWELEMQLYTKTIKVLQDCGCHNTECMADTLLSMGACRVGQGQFGAAMGCYEEAHDIYTQRHGERSEKVALSLHHMGVVHCELDELDYAMTMLKTSLKIKQANGMKEGNDEKTADTLCWIGKVYREQGYPEKAKKYFDTARDVKSELCGADSLEVAEILHNIAILVDDEGDFERSLRYYRKSLRIRRAALGDQHEDVCELIACIGNVYKSMGDERTALKALRRAIEIRACMIKGTIPNQQQTKVLIGSYEDVLNLLRTQLRVSDNPDEEQDEIASILLKMGHLHDTIGNFSRSDRCFDKSLELRYASNDNVKAGQVLNVKGISFAKRQKYTDAMSSFEKALQLRKAALGDTHIDVAETLHNMGNCAAKSKDLSDAGAYYDEALRIKRKNIGNKGTSVAQTLHNIGNVHVAQGRDDAAMKSYQEALDLRIECLGSDHVEVAYSLHCIGKVNRKQHDIDTARENFNAALRIKRLKLPKNHHSIAETLEQLGSLYMEIGEDDEAILCLNGALNIYKSKSGEGVKVAEVYEQLGSKHEKKNDIAKALMFFNKALRVRERILGEDHVSIADMYHRIGKLHRDQDSDHNALSAFQAATKIRKKAMGRNDLVISEILTDAGELQMKLGQVEVAEKCVDEAIRIQNLILDSRHEKVGKSLLLKGSVQLKKKEYEEAIHSFNEALEIFQGNSEDYFDQYISAMENLGVAYKENGDYEQACESYEKCLALLPPSGKENLDSARVNNGIGEVYYAKGDYGKAEEYFRDGVEVLVSNLGEDHLTVANAVLSLGRTCTKLSSPDEAIMYFEQARLTKQMRLGDDHLEVSDINLEMGRAYAVKKDYEEALQCFQSYLRARRALLEDDEVACDTMLEIGLVQQDLKREDAALQSFASALTLYRVILGDEHVKVAKTLYGLGCVYETKREFKESMKYHKEAFRLRRRLFGQDDLAVAESLDKVCNLYMKQPNLEKALHGMREVLRIRTMKLGKEHVEVGATLFAMGVIFCETDDLEKAMECYEVALKIRSDHFGESSVEVAQTLHNMGTVFGKQQNFESALSHWRKALVAYREAGLSDEDHLVAVTIGNINMAEAYLE